MGFWVMVLSFILGVLFVVMGLRRSSESRLKPLWLGLGVLFFVAAVWLAWPKSVLPQIDVVECGSKLACPACWL